MRSTSKSLANECTSLLLYSRHNTEKPLKQPLPRHRFEPQLKHRRRIHIKFTKANPFSKHVNKTHVKPFIHSK
jgi:hypothetical protein